MIDLANLKSVLALGGHSAAHDRWLFIVVAGLFAALVIAGAVIYRRLAGRAELELAEKLIDEEYDRLEHRPASGQGHPPS